MTTTFSIYGCENATYAVRLGRVWLVQSDDRDDLPVEVDSIPDDCESLDAAVCVGMELPDCQTWTRLDRHYDEITELEHDRLTAAGVAWRELDEELVAFRQRLLDDADPFFAPVANRWREQPYRETISYTVEVRCIGGWTTHSEHTSYRDAVDQSDMVGGRVVVTSTGCLDTDAHRYAVIHQEFQGDYTDWRLLDDEERDAYEIGAGA